MRKARSVPLLIDRLPIDCRFDRTCEPSEEYWAIRVPILLTPVGQRPAPDARPLPWVIDTGFTGEAFAWRHHLEESGIDFDKAKQRRAKIRWSASGEEASVWLCRAHLWLVSNVDAPRKVHRLTLYRGLTCNETRVAAPDPERHRALIGMRLLIRLGLKVEIDSADRTFSISTAGP